MAIFWTALPALLLGVVIWLDMYVFRSQWNDDPQDDDEQQAIPRPTVPQKAATHRKAQHAAQVR